MDYAAQGQQLLETANAVLANPDGSYSSVSSAQKLAVRISDFLSLNGQTMDDAAGGQDPTVSALSQMVDQLTGYSSGNASTLQKNSVMDGAAAFGNSITEDLNAAKTAVGNAWDAGVNLLNKADPTKMLGDVSHTIIIVAVCAVAFLFLWKKPA
jgi:hypothetical protein